MNLQCIRTDHGLAVYQDGQVWTTMLDNMLFDMASQEYIARKHTILLTKSCHVLCTEIESDCTTCRLVSVTNGKTVSNPIQSIKEPVRQLYTQLVQKCNKSNDVKARCRRAAASCDSTATHVTTVPHQAALPMTKMEM